MLVKKNQTNLQRNNFFIQEEDFDEFLYDPTPLSAYFKHQIKLLYQKKIASLKNNAWRRLLFQFNLLSYAKLNHQAAFNQLKKINQQVNFLTDYSLAESMILFLKTQEILMNNNLALSVFYLKNKIKIENKSFHTPLTFEEQSKLFLQMIQKKPTYLTKFKKQFAHYSMNNYELAARRFAEYSDVELLILAKFTKDLKLRAVKINSNVADQLIINPLTVQDIYWNLLLIRDVAKDVSIKIVALIRQKVLVIAETRHIADPFQLEWKNLLKLIK